MTGPCLCGDPFCSSCGNPEQEELSEAIEQFVDELLELNINKYEFEMVKASIIELINAHRKCCQEVISELHRDTNIHLQYLEDSMAEKNQMIAELIDKLKVSQSSAK